MNRTISNPNKVNHKIYIGLIILFLITLKFSFSAPTKINLTFPNLSDIIKNLSYGCIASTAVAWMIDCANIRNLNKKANNTYEAIYADLRIHIGYYIGTWATLCAVAFKNKDYYAEKHTWEDWYKITKENYCNSDTQRQRELSIFFHNQLSSAVKKVNKCIDHLFSQQYMLKMNDLMNSDMENILSDFQFEFYALDLTLSRENPPMDFWKSMDTITNDLKNYIRNWQDIQYYNLLVFKPYSFFKRTDDLVEAMYLSESLQTNTPKSKSFLNWIKLILYKVWSFKSLWATIMNKIQSCVIRFKKSLHPQNNSINMKTEIIGVLLVAMFAIVILFILLDRNTFRKELVPIVCGILTYAGTCFMGLVALWQNKKIHQESIARSKPEVQILIKKITTEKTHVTDTGTMIYVVFRNCSRNIIRQIHVSKAKAAYNEEWVKTKTVRAHIYSETNADIIYIFILKEFTYERVKPIDLEIEYIITDELGQKHPETKNIRAFIPDMDEKTDDVIYIDMN